jgi:hypothetical protein
MQDPAFTGLTEHALPLFKGLSRLLHTAVHAGPAAQQPFAPDRVCPFEAAEASVAREHLSLAWQAAPALVESPLYAPLTRPALISVGALAPLIAWIMKACIAADGPGKALCVRAAEAALTLVTLAARIPDVKARLTGAVATAPPVCVPLMHALLCTVHAPCSDAARAGALAALSALAGEAEPGRVCLDDGGAVLLLAAALAAVPPAAGAAPAALLAQLLAAPTVYQAQQQQQLRRVLPPALLTALQGTDAAVFTEQLHTSVDTAELVWTPAMRKRTAAAVAAAAEAAAAAMRRDAGAPAWTGSVPQVEHPELDYDLYVGGVYLKRFLETSKASSGQELRDPAAFFDGLMLELGRAMDAAATAAAKGGVAALERPSDDTTIGPSELAQMLGRAVELVLGRYNTITGHAVTQGYVEWLVARVPGLAAAGEALAPVTGTALRILLQLSLSPVSAQRLAAPTPPLVPCVQACVPCGLAAAIFSLDILRCALHSANPDRQELVHQAVVHGLTAQLLGLLEPGGAAPIDLVPSGYVARAGLGSDTAAKADSDYIRNLGVEVIRLLMKPGLYEEQVCPRPPVQLEVLPCIRV